jgi:hypothetical protein
VFLIYLLKYCAMTPESRNIEISIDVLLGNDSVKHSRCNEYAGNNRVTSVAMQWYCKHAFRTI